MIKAFIDCNCQPKQPGGPKMPELDLHQQEYKWEEKIKDKNAFLAFL